MSLVRRLFLCTRLSANEILTLGTDISSVIENITDGYGIAEDHNIFESFYHLI